MTARSELKFAIGLIAFTLFNYFYLIPTQVIAEGSSPVYPYLVNTLLLLFSLAYLTEGILAYKKQMRENKGQNQKANDFWAVHWRPLAMFALTGVWIFTLEYTGFLLSTMAFLMVGARIFASRSLKKTLIVAIVMPSLITVIFLCLNAPLPEGPAEALIHLVTG